MKDFLYFSAITIMFMVGLFFIAATIGIILAFFTGDILISAGISTALYFLSIGFLITLMIED